MNETKINGNQLNLSTKVWNFSDNSYLQSEIINFESGTSYDFTYHFTTRQSTYGTDSFIFSSIDVEGTGGGFDITYQTNRGALWISQSGKDVSAWAFDGSLGDISTYSEYWLHMIWDGSVYTYILATDKGFTNIIKTTTFNSTQPIKNTTANSRWGRAIRTNFYSSYWRGSIEISDCIMKINGATVFDGRKGSNWTIIGDPRLFTTFY